MRYLLDTNIVLFAGNRKLPEKTLELLDDPDHAMYISIASLWEMAIKESIGKLRLPKNYLEEIEQRCHILPIKPEHIASYRKLPLHHRDPFDRMIIAQALTEKLHCLTSDSSFSSYMDKKLTIITP